MEKRKYLVMTDRYPYSKEESLIISYTDKEYKIYDFNDNGNYCFYPSGVKIEHCTIDNLYFIRFGKLYKRCAINQSPNNSKHGRNYHKKYNKRMYFLKVDNDLDERNYIKIFDDLDTAKLWLELRDKGDREDAEEKAYTESAGR